jgi:hypothetical protein
LSGGFVESGAKAIRVLLPPVTLTTLLHFDGFNFNTTYTTWTLVLILALIHKPYMTLVVVSL